MNESPYLNEIREGGREEGREAARAEWRIALRDDLATVVKAKYRLAVLPPDVFVRIADEASPDELIRWLVLVSMDLSLEDFRNALRAPSVTAAATH